MSTVGAGEGPWRGSWGALAWAWVLGQGLRRAGEGARECDGAVSGVWAGRAGMAMDDGRLGCGSARVRGGHGKPSASATKELCARLRLCSP